MSLTPRNIVIQLNQNKSVEYSSETVEEELFLHSHEGSKQLKMINCIFNHNVHLSLDASGTYNIDFSGSIFNGRLHIFVTDVTNTKISIKQSTLNSGLTVKCNSPIEIDCTGMKWDLEIMLEESRLDKLLFEQVKFANPSANHIFHATHLNVLSETSFKESELGTAFFSYSQFDSNANFSRCRFNGAHFIDVKFLADAYFSEVELGDFVAFNGSEFYGTLVAPYINQQSIKCSADFSGCLFEKNVYFDSAIFRQYTCRRSNFQKQVSFNNSKIVEVDFIGSFFQNGADFTHTKYLKGGVETFRLIKSELLRAGNKVESLYYQSRELHLYDAKLKWSDSPSEKILLLLNKYSTNHGVDWVRGVKFTIGVSFFFYSLYITTLPCKEFEWGWNDWASFHAASNYVVTNYFNFLALFRDFSLLNDSCPFWISSAIDFFGRIFIAYGVYQTIQAFRKYGKT